MDKYQDTRTQAEKIDFIREKLETDEVWMIRGAIAIYRKQTDDEKRSEDTNVFNGVGFTGADGKMMTSLVNTMLRKGVINHLKQNKSVKVSDYLTPKQEYHFKNRIVKYARQLMKIAEDKI